MNRKNLKGFTINDLAPIAIAFVIVAIVGAFGAMVLDDVYDSVYADNNTSVALEITNYGLDALTDLMSWLPLLAIVVIAAVIIGILLYYFKLK